MSPACSCIRVVHLVTVRFCALLCLGYAQTYWVLFGSFSFFCFLCPKFGIPFLPKFVCNQLAIWTQWIPSCSSGLIQHFLDHFVDQCRIFMGYFSLSFYPIDFKLGTMILRHCSFMLWEFTAVLSDLFRIIWITMWIDVGSMMQPHSWYE